MEIVKNNMIWNPGETIYEIDSKPDGIFIIVSGLVNIYSRDGLLLNSIGEVLYLEDESLMDAVTAISGSGPAYFYYFVEAIVYSGISIGLSKKHSLKLAKETFLGAAVLLEKSNEDVSSLRENVTSPGGTTEAALKILQKNNQYFKLVKKAIISARNRGIEFSDEFK